MDDERASGYRLMAVAPEAVEVCHELVAWLDQWSKTPLPVDLVQIKPTYEKAKAIIARTDPSPPRAALPSRRREGA
jgi:hypothetical protein